MTGDMRPDPDAMWQLPATPFDEFPSPADLQPYLEITKRWREEMVKVYDIGNEVRSSWRLQQVATVLWLGLDTSLVYNLRLVARVDRSGYDVIEWASTTNADPIPEKIEGLICNGRWDGETTTYHSAATLTDDAGVALWNLIGPPALHCWPTHSRRRT